MPHSGGRRSLRTRVAWTAQIVRRAPFEARFPFRPPAEIERAQRRRLRAAVAHAREHVPFYREEMRRLGLGVDDFGDVADLARLPLIEREQVQRDPERFLSQAEPPDHYVEQRSSGSTGKPMTISHDPYSLFEQAIYTERRRSILSKLAGRRRFREARVADIPGTAAGGGHVRAAFTGISLVPPGVRVKRGQFSAVEPLEQLVEELDAFRPDVIASFGSFHEMLFAHLLKSGRPIHLPRVISFAGDGLSDSSRAMILREFGIPALSAYTSVEAFQIGFECDHHRGHHLNLDLFPVRIIGDDGVELPDGESGEVVVSNLQARGTVLFNYRLNDFAARLPEACSCGRNLPLISMVQGRRDEWLLGAGGRRIHSQAIRVFLGDQPEILRYQVVQDEPGRLRAALVTTPGTDERALRGRVAERFEGVLGRDVAVELELVDSLPRTQGAKVRAVIPIEAGPGVVDAGDAR